MGPHPTPIAFKLDRLGLAMHHIVFVSALTAFFGSPAVVLWILDPQSWRAWLLFVLAMMFFAAYVNSTPRSIYAWLRRRPPVVIIADGISLGFRETIPWSAVAGLHVDDDETLSLELTQDEMDRRGYDPTQGLAMRRVHFDVPLTWIDGEPREIIDHARPFLESVPGSE